MTHLELVAKIGNDSLDVAKMYLKGQLTVGELTNILGKDRTMLIQQFAGDRGAENGGGRLKDLIGAQFYNSPYTSRCSGELVRVMRTFCGLRKGQ